MIVISLSSIPPKLRGYLTKYLWEISPGVYVGDVNARVREALWDRVLDNANDISKGVLVFPADNEQGFEFLSLGPSWKPIDYEGLKLIIKKDEDGFGKKENELRIASIPDEYVVLDIETTGLDPNNDKILEIGAIRIKNGKTKEKFQAIVKTDVPKNIVSLTGITQEQADQGISIKDALMQLKEFIQNNPTVGYNIRMFDLKFIKKECLRNNVPIPFQKITDVLDLTRKIYPNLQSYQLGEIAKEKQITVVEEHRALADCELCNKIYRLCSGAELSGMD